MGPIARHPIGKTLPFREGLSRLGRSAASGYRFPGFRVGLSLAAGVAAISLLTVEAVGADPHTLLVVAVLLLLAVQGALLAESALAQREVRASAPGAAQRPSEGPNSEGEKADCARCSILANVRQFEVHRTDYVATISHELKTPLTSIKGFAQLLLRGEGISGDAAHSYARMIAAEADRLSRIVNDIVDLTRMETGLLGLRREPMHPTRLIRAAVDSLRTAGSPPALRLQLPSWLPTVRGDPERLQQVLRWLIADALSRTCEGSGVLLSAEGGKQGLTVRLSYAATQERISDLMRALEGPAVEGVGVQATRLGRGRLALYISKNFIEAHGGRMWVEMPPESRVVVAFTLPPYEHLSRGIRGLSS